MPSKRKFDYLTILRWAKCDVSIRDFIDDLDGGKKFAASTLKTKFRTFFKGIEEEMNNHPNDFRREDLQHCWRILSDYAEDFDCPVRAWKW